MSKTPTIDQAPKDIAMPPLPPEEIAQALPSDAPAIDEPEIVSDPLQALEAPSSEEKPINKELATAKEKNFTEMRIKAARAERERDELLERYQELQSRQQQQPKTDINPEPDDSFGIKDDELAEGKHLNKVYKELKEVRKELASYKQQSSVMTVEQRIRQEMPDFASVVNEENVALLRTMEPEMAESISNNPDYYSKAKSAYRMIEKLGIHTRETFAAEKAIAQKNAAKPRPLTSVNPQQGDSPLSKANAFANGLTEELRSQLMKEMQQARKEY